MARQHTGHTGDLTTEGTQLRQPAESPVRRPVVLGLLLLALSVLAIVSVFLPWYSFGAESIDGRTVLDEADTPDGMIVLVVGALGVVGSLLYLVPARPLRVLCGVGAVLGGAVVAALAVYKISQAGDVTPAEREAFELLLGGAPMVRAGLYLTLLAGAVMAVTGVLATMAGARGRPAR